MHLFASELSSHCSERHRLGLEGYIESGWKARMASALPACLWRRK